MLPKVGVAVTATGVAIGVGVVTTGAASDVPVATDRSGSLVASLAGTAQTPADVAPAESRTEAVSRSDRRGQQDGAKRQALLGDVGGAVSGEEDLSDADPREIGRVLLLDYGFEASQFSCLDSLYTRESNWRTTADNPTSSAYGIPQALPGSKMSSAGADWATNPVTQIRWGLGYIEDRYGTPCGAWAHSQRMGWY